MTIVSCVIFKTPLSTSTASQPWAVSVTESWVWLKTHNDSNLLGPSRGIWIYYFITSTTSYQPRNCFYFFFFYPGASWSVKSLIYGSIKGRYATVSYWTWITPEILNHRLFVKYDSYQKYITIFSNRNHTKWFFL